MIRAVRVVSREGEIHATWSVPVPVRRHTTATTKGAEGGSRGERFISGIGAHHPAFVRRWAHTWVRLGSRLGA